MKKCGKTTEVYSRVTGYFRPIKNWNVGKQEEFRNRLMFVATPAAQSTPADHVESACAETASCACS